MKAWKISIFELSSPNASRETKGARRRLGKHVKHGRGCETGEQNQLMCNWKCSRDSCRAVGPIC